MFWVRIGLKEIGDRVLGFFFIVRICRRVRKVVVEGGVDVR